MKTRIGGAVGDADRPTLCDLLDRLIETGVVARGSIVVSVAGIELIYIEISLLVSSVETAFGGAKPGPMLQPMLEAAA